MGIIVFFFELSTLVMLSQMVKLSNGQIVEINKNFVIFVYFVVKLAVLGVVMGF